MYRTVQLLLPTGGDAGTDGAELLLATPVLYSLLLEDSLRYSRL